MKNHAEPTGRCPKRGHMLQVMAPNHFGVGSSNLGVDPFPRGDPFAPGATPLPQGQPLCPRGNPFAPRASPLPQGQPLCPRGFEGSKVTLGWHGGPLWAWVRFGTPFSQKMLQNHYILQGLRACEVHRTGSTGSSGSVQNEAQQAARSPGSPRLRSG